MTKQNRVRIGKLLVVLALVLGIAGFTEYKAEAYCQGSSFPYCTACMNCEGCAASEQSCIAGTANGPCYGDASCCQQLFSGCYQCCVWY